MYTLHSWNLYKLQNSNWSSYVCIHLIFDMIFVLTLRDRWCSTPWTVYHSISWLVEPPTNHLHLSHPTETWQNRKYGYKKNKRLKFNKNLLIVVFLLVYGDESKHSFKLHFRNKKCLYLWCSLITSISLLSLEASLASLAVAPGWYNWGVMNLISIQYIEDWGLSRLWLGQGQLWQGVTKERAAAFKWQFLKSYIKLFLKN